MSLATIVTSITRTAQDITRTLQETQQAVNTFGEYTTTALNMMDTYFDTDTKHVQQEINTYTTTTDDLLNTTIDFTDQVGTYQNLDLVYTTDTYTESTEVLEHHGLEDVSQILQGKQGWSWEKRAENLREYTMNNALTQHEKDAVLHTLDQNQYLQQNHSDLYTDMTMDILFS